MNQQRKTIRLTYDKLDGPQKTGISIYFRNSLHNLHLPWHFCFFFLLRSSKLFDLVVLVRIYEHKRFVPGVLSRRFLVIFAATRIFFRVGRLEDDLNPLCTRNRSFLSVTGLGDRLPAPDLPDKSGLVEKVCSKWKPLPRDRMDDFQGAWRCVETFQVQLEDRQCNQVTTCRVSDESNLRLKIKINSLSWTGGNIIYNVI